jgi:two-component system chemotaxis response regulator CheB
MATRDIVVVGGSAGAVEVATELARGLPADFPAAVALVIHFPDSGTSVLPRILSRAGVLPALHAADGEPIAPGRIYIAPPGCHLVLHDGVVRLSRGPKENGHRPAIDPLFRSAARYYGPRVIGVVLSGNLNDGTVGLRAIKRAGGVAVVQQPETAMYPGMPRSAIRHVPVDHVVPVPEVSALLAGLVGQPAPEVTIMPDDVAPDGAEEEVVIADRERQPGTPSTYACPECHGVLWEAGNGEVVEFRCRVGHAYTAEALLAHQTEQLEAAMWTALRSLEEHAALARRLAARAHGRGHEHSASAFTEQAMDAEHHASVIRGVLQAGLSRAAVAADATP